MTSPRTPSDSQGTSPSATACYCCSCKYNEWGALVVWDPACMNHGAHGTRGCEKHGIATKSCGCGCGYEVKEGGGDMSEQERRCKVCDQIAEDGPIGSDGRAVCGSCYDEWKSQGAPR